MFSAPRFTRLAMDVRRDAVPTRLAICDITFDSTRIACDACELCALPRRLAHGSMVLFRLRGAHHFGYQLSTLTGLATRAGTASTKHNVEPYISPVSEA